MEDENFDVRSFAASKEQLTIDDPIDVSILDFDCPEDDPNFP